MQFKFIHTFIGKTFTAIPVVSLCLLIALTDIGQAEEKVNINFRSADIRAVVKAIGDITGKTFILHPNVSGKVTIVSSTPVSEDLVYDIFLSALRLRGFTAVEENGITKIIPAKDAKANAGPVVDENSVQSGDRLITQIYQLKHASANELRLVLRPFVSPHNTIAAIPAANILIISDFAGNLKRVGKILSAIDVPDLSKARFIKLEHISAIDFISIYKKVYGKKSSAARGGVPGIMPGDPQGRGGAPGGGVYAGAAKGSSWTIVPETRSNSLIVKTDDPVTMDRINSLVEQLDVPTKDMGNIHVVKLKYANPTKIAKMISNIISSSGGQGSSFSTSAPVSQPIPPDALGLEGGGGEGGESRKDSSDSWSGNSKVMPDDNTKSVIIIASDHVYKYLRTLIAKLDVRPRQIFVEALIAEIVTDRIADFGIQWQSLRGLDATKQPHVIGVGGTNLGATTGNSVGGVSTAEGGAGLITPSSVGQGLNIGIVNGTITLPDGTVIPNLLALGHALQSDADANILSTPTLLALDNEWAKITVGQNVPFLTGQFTTQASGNTGSEGNNINPFQTIERKDVGLTFKIKPQITDIDTVRMSIFQEISALVPAAVASGARDVVTNKRSLESDILMEDGQIIVLGGLIQNSLKLTEQKVPLLGDIPILGHLFRYESRQRERTNLLIFIRPHIFREAEDSLGITGKAYNYIIDKEGDVKPWPNLLLPNMDTPQLPELQYKKDKYISVPDILEVDPSDKESEK